jgi:TonB family protein
MSSVLVAPPSVEFELLEHETPLSMAIGLSLSGEGAQSSRPDMSEILSAVKETREFVESQSRRGPTFRIDTNSQTAEPATDARSHPARGDVVKNVLLQQTKPEYPPLAKAARVQGTVKLELKIGSDGVVKDSRLISGPPLLVAAAASAVHNWKFRPATSDGVPVESTHLVDIRFTLPQ